MCNLPSAVWAEWRLLRATAVTRGWNGRLKRVSIRVCTFFSRVNFKRETVSHHSGFSSQVHCSLRTVSLLPEVRISSLVSWCFEPSQPQRVIYIPGIVKTNFSPSPSHSVDKSLNLRSRFLKPQLCQIFHKETNAAYFIFLSVFLFTFLSVFIHTNSLYEK